MVGADCGVGALGGDEVVEAAGFFVPELLVECVVHALGFCVVVGFFGEFCRQMAHFFNALYQSALVSTGMGAADCRGGPAAEAIAFEPFAAGGVCGSRVNVESKRMFIGPQKKKGRRDRMLPAGTTTW